MENLVYYAIRVNRNKKYRYFLAKNELIDLLPFAAFSNAFDFVVIFGGALDALVGDTSGRFSCSSILILLRSPSLS